MKKLQLLQRAILISQIILSLHSNTPCYPSNDLPTHRNPIFTRALQTITHIRRSHLDQQPQARQRRHRHLYVRRTSNFSPFSRIPVLSSPIRIFQYSVKNSQHTLEDKGLRTEQLAGYLPVFGHAWSTFCERRSTTLSYVVWPQNAL